MMRMIRAALVGIIVGIVGGAIVGQVYYVRYLYRKVQQERDKAVNAIVYSDDSAIYGDMFEEELGIENPYASLFGIMDSGAFDDNFLMENEPTEKTDISMPEIIQLNVIYTGDEALTSDEKADLQSFVKQAVLYALAEKLGEDYNQSMTKEEIRRNLILSLEYINQVAGESAEEWGVDTNARASFDVQYVQEGEVDGVWCPAGYYEVLKIYLTE